MAMIQVIQIYKLNICLFLIPKETNVCKHRGKYVQNIETV